MLYDAIHDWSVDGESGALPTDMGFVYRHHDMSSSLRGSWRAGALAHICRSLYFSSVRSVPMNAVDCLSEVSKKNWHYEAEG